MRFKLRSGPPEPHPPIRQRRHRRPTCRSRMSKTPASCRELPSVSSRRSASVSCSCLCCGEICRPLPSPSRGGCGSRSSREHATTESSPRRAAYSKTRYASAPRNTRCRTRADEARADKGGLPPRTGGQLKILQHADWPTNTMLAEAIVVSTERGGYRVPDCIDNGDGPDPQANVEMLFGKAERVEQRFGKGLEQVSPGAALQAGGHRHGDDRSREAAARDNSGSTLFLFGNR